jgi:NAD(P)-dependent dehydrogenase (short-subunit alcohol dehydrogenase family)
MTDIPHTWATPPRTFGLVADDAVSFVTGAANGIGRGCALALAADEVAVVVADVDEVGGSETVAMIEASGGRAAFVHCDVAEEPAVAAAVDEAVATFGHLDCAVNAAGINSLTTDVTGSEWEAAPFDRVFGVNVRGMLFSVKHEVRHMVPRGYGAIVNIASGAAFIGIPGAPAYTSSKHAVVGITRSAGVEHAPAGIRINAVCPGGIRTAQTAGMEEHLPGAHPIGRMGEPHEIGTAAAWLCSSHASFVVATAILVDGGYTAV